MTKRISALLLALLTALSLTACGGRQGSAPSAPPSQAPASLESASQAPEADPTPGPEESPAETPDPDVSIPEETPVPTDTPAPAQETPPQEEDPGEEPLSVTEDGWYNSRDEVALYIHLFGHLPDNYVTKREAQDAGWTGGSVEPYTGEGTAMGGSRFGNYEGLLPEAPGRSYTECDIDTVGASSRGAKRIVFSNDGLIYYTGDHYESFELLYGEP